jgi:hypothetical protein
MTICVLTPLNCFADSECAVGTKCCPYGCGRICLSKLKMELFQKNIFLYYYNYYLETV